MNPSIARRLWSAALLLLFQTAPNLANAGEDVTCFSRGNLGSCSSVVLEHVGFKSVILQYVDPDKTELGEGLARLLWREILESISDLSDAGVILAYDRNGEIERALGEEDVSAFLGREYHAAALRIAEQQNVEMAIWGSILEDGSDLYIQNFLTLRAPDDNPWTRLSFSNPRNDSQPLATELGRSRINLPPLRASRDGLFARNFVTRCKLSNGCPDGIQVRSGPSNDAPVVSHLPTASTIQTTAMHKQWLQLAPSASTAPGEARWINLYHVEMFPLEVRFDQRRQINMRSSPGGTPIAQVDLDGPYEVINAARHGEFQNPWVEIRAGGKQGWIAGHLANRRSWTFPSIHMIAGLYRYGRGQYDRAALEFSSYLELSPVDDNVTRAEVHKFLAASRLAAQGRSPSSVTFAIDQISQAAKLTPFDGSVYALRSFVGIVQPQTFDRAIRDLETAIELDRGDANTRLLIRSVQQKLEAKEIHGVPAAISIQEASSRLKILQQKMAPLHSVDGEALRVMP